MADAKLTSLTAATAVTADDLLYVVDDPSGSPTSKKVTAAVFRDFTNMVHSTVTGTSGAIAGAVNTLYVADMSGWTANRTLTLPATAAVGDRVGMMVSVGDADYEWLVQADTGDSLNGVTAAEWSRLFITGETIVCRCVVANTTWVVEMDGRIPSACRIYRSADVATTATTLQTAPLDTNDTAFSVGGLSNVGSNNILLRRSGRYRLEAIEAVSLITSGSYFYGGFAVGGSLFRIFSYVLPGVSGVQYINGSMSYTGTDGDAISLMYQTNDATSKNLNGGNDAGTTQLVVVEDLS